MYMYLTDRFSQLLIVPGKGIWNLWDFCLRNPESWALEFGIQLKESGISLRIGIQNPSTTKDDWNLVPGTLKS